MQAIKTIPYFLILLLFSCSNEMPNWLLKSNHAISPDGKVAIYSSKLDENGISIGTWINTEIGSGGAGVFDIKTTDSSGVNLSWITDKMALIEYPRNSEIIRKEDSSFFAERTIIFSYKIKNN